MAQTSRLEPAHVTADIGGALYCLIQKWSRQYSRFSPLLFSQCLLLLITLFFLSSAHAATTLDARVDRTSVSEGDSLTLTLTLNDTGNYPDPDLSVMQRDFSIVSMSQGSNHILANGHIQSSTEWQITLMPKRGGLLTIPAFDIDSYRSKPIAIRVQPADANAGTSAADGEPVFMETEVDHDSVYVQQQVLFKVRVFHSIALDDMNLTEPEFDNATVRKVSQQDFRREIGGVTYQVHELSYAIFPQQSGDLTIPEVVFSGAEMQRRRLFDFPGQGRPVRKLSKQIAIHVKPAPPQFTGKVWLPARNLTVQETWGGNPEDIKAGNSITRSIAIQADGLMAAQLPALDTPTLQQARLYADQPALDDQADSSGMHGMRKENAALIPSREGPLQLPESRIVWWDLDSDSEKVATIPAQTLTIKRGLDGVTPPPATAENVATTANNSLANSSSSPQGNTVNALSTSARYPLLWMVIAGIFAACWLLTMVLYWRLRHHLSAPEKASPTPTYFDNSPELFSQVVRACTQNNAQAAYSAFRQWVRAISLETPDQWLRTQDASAEILALSNAVEHLQRQIYREESLSWNGAELANALNAWRKRKDKKTDRKSALPALYPT